jgi:predicted RNA-binding protein with PUA-like domain
MGEGGRIASAERPFFDFEGDGFPMAFWLIKTEPGEYGWPDLVRDERTAWTGVRNFQARNNLRAMKRGDRCLVYHSVDAKEVVGVAEVVRTAYPDPTAKDGDWSCVDVAAVCPLPRPVTLAQIKAEARLKAMALVRNSRLSVSPVTETEFKRILALGADGPQRRG